MKIGTTDVSKVYVGTSEITKAYLGDTLVYGGGPAPVDYTQIPFTIEATSSGTFKWYNLGERTMKYALNGDIETSYETLTSATTLNLSAGDKLELAGDYKNYYNPDNNVNYGRFATTFTFNLYGNIMSLMYSTSFKTPTTITNNSAFKAFFLNNSNILDASNLVLPAESLAQNCYYSMFGNCSGMTAAPKSLPALGLEWASYNEMFAGCTSLVTAPSILATSVSSYSCKGMFKGCTSLVTAPPSLLATGTTTGTYEEMFYGCTSLVTPPSIAGKRIGQYVCRRMFQNCSSLERAPEILYTSSAYDSFYEMFSGCSKLNYVKCLMSNGGGSNFGDWMYGVSANGTFVKATGATWTTGTSGIPSGWTVEEE